MKKKPVTPFSVLVILVLICSGLVLAWFKSNTIRGLYNELVLDNKDHFLSCAELPPVAEVEQVVDSHRDAIDQIKQVNPGSVFVEIDSTTCPGKADIVISYGTHQTRLAIEQIIAADTFFGVPYRLRNI
jgi:hypothetical protein